MPKKTKKEKIKRMQERKYVGHRPTESVISVEQKNPEVPSTHHFSFQRSAIATKPGILSAADQEMYAYLRRDLIKTVALAIIAFTILFVLSFTLK